MLLPRRLLSKAVSLYLVSESVEDGWLLLPKANAVCAVLSYVLLPGRLLPKAVSAILLACEQATPSLSAGQ